MKKNIVSILLITTFCLLLIDIGFFTECFPIIIEKKYFWIYFIIIYIFAYYNGRQEFEGIKKLFSKPKFWFERNSLYESDEYINKEAREKENATFVVIFTLFLVGGLLLFGTKYCN